MQKFRDPVDAKIDRTNTKMIMEAEVLRIYIP